MNPESELLALVEQIRHAEDEGVVFSTRQREHLLTRLTSLIQQAFPHSHDLAPEIARALLGDAPAPLPPRWWQKGDVAVVTLSAEEEALSLLLESCDPAYFPECDSDPLTSSFLASIESTNQDAPSSYLVFALLSFLRALLWGYHRFWRLEAGRLLSLREILKEVYVVNADLLDALSALSRRHGTLPILCNRQAEVVLSEFFALPGSLTLLDALATIYGDVVVGLRGADASSGLQYPRTPVPKKDTQQLTWRVRVVHKILGSAQLTAKVFRKRKATVLEILNGGRS